MSDEFESLIDGINDCEICGELITSKYKWSISITNGNRGFFKRRSCRNCIKKITKSPINRIKFFEIINAYALKNNLSKYASEHWSDIHIEKLQKLLNDYKIPIIDYGIPLYELYKTEEKIYLHNFKKIKSR